MRSLCGYGTRRERLCRLRHSGWRTVQVFGGWPIRVLDLACSSLLTKGGRFGAQPGSGRPTLAQSARLNRLSEDSGRPANQSMACLSAFRGWCLALAAMACQGLAPGLLAQMAAEGPIPTAASSEKSALPEPVEARQANSTAAPAEGTSRRDSYARHLQAPPRPSTFRLHPGQRLWQRGGELRLLEARSRLWNEARGSRQRQDMARQRLLPGRDAEGSAAQDANQPGN